MPGKGCAPARAPRRRRRGSPPRALRARRGRPACASWGRAGRPRNPM